MGEFWKGGTKIESKNGGNDESYEKMEESFGPDRRNGCADSSFGRVKDKKI